MSDAIELIDTNILVYAYDATDKHKHLKAKELIEKCWTREITYAISSQNLAEFLVIITKKVPRPLSIDQAQQIIFDICSFSGWKVLHYNQSTLLLAIQMYKSHHKHFWDALILATMREAGITHIYSENEADFRLFENVTVINPFKK